MNRALSHFSRNISKLLYEKKKSLFSSGEFSQLLAPRTVSNTACLALFSEWANDNLSVTRKVLVSTEVVLKNNDHNLGYS